MTRMTAPLLALALLGVVVYDLLFPRKPGEEGGPFPYEVDQQGLANWTLWQHYVFHPSKSYLDTVYPAIARAADWMTLYTEPSGRHRRYMWMWSSTPPMSYSMPFSARMMPPM